MSDETDEVDAEEVDERDLVMWPFLDELEHNGPEALAEYLEHCGVTIAIVPAIQEAVALHPEIEEAIARHYRLPDGTYDIDRAAGDLATWPPVAARIEELRAERAARGEDIG